MLTISLKACKPSGAFEDNNVFHIVCPDGTLITAALKNKKGWISTSISAPRDYIINRGFPKELKDDTTRISKE